MSELHIPMSSYDSTNMMSHHNSSLGYWDQYFHNLGVLNSEAMSLVMDHGNSTPFFSSSASVDDHDHDYDYDHHDNLSTGYLEDALVEFTERSKRRRLLMFGDEDIITMRENSNFLPKSYFNSSNWELAQNFSFMTHMTSGNFNELSVGGPIPTSICSIGEEANFIVESPEEEKSVSEILDSSASSTSSYKDSANNSAKSIVSHKETLFPVDPLGCEEKLARKKRANPAIVTRVVYPFAVVKPGGREGDVTLNDINERIMMPPTRPVRHPVGDFACRPCVSPHGPGLSGKAVVALTRIHTQGRGTITIIRTKG